MAEVSFADRYAEAGLSPSADTVRNRQASVARIIEQMELSQVSDLIGAYYGLPGFDLTWLRDEFAIEDTAFSFVNNARECRILSAIILGRMIEDHDAPAALGVVVGRAGGHRQPAEARWLLDLAEQALVDIAAGERKRPEFEPKIGWTNTPKLDQEIGAVGEGDWAALLAILGKMRTEYQSSMRSMSTQATAVVTALRSHGRMQHEETEILWWLIGGHSRSLDRSFSGFESHQAAIVASLDLATLTTFSRAGPLAAAAMLERILTLSKKPKGATSRSLLDIVDGISRDDQLRLPLTPKAVTAQLAPVTTALELARTIGQGAWGAKFEEVTGLPAISEFEPLTVALQLYREHLLGQLL